MTKAWLRPSAEADLIERTRHYRSEGGDNFGERFFEAALKSLRSVERMPGIGSPLVGEMCEVPGLRSVPVGGFPVKWLYFVAEDRLDVVRLLASSQDLKSILEP